MTECNPAEDESKSAQILWKAGKFSWNLDDRALVMAILNVTPDSFSDGGLHLDLFDTLAAAYRFIEEGADILDVGGESTRPGAVEVGSDDEISRVIPVIKKLVSSETVPVSIDTCKAEVAAAGLAAGATIVNDVTGLRDPAMIDVCVGSDCGIVVMHMQGNPRTMQNSPTYEDVVSELGSFFEERFETLVSAGIESERIVFDPGIGFGKSLSHNLELLNRVEDYRVHDRPILMGLSRKTLIGQLLGDPAMSRREFPTQALTALTRQRGAMIHRVHQVREVVQVLRMTEAVMGS
ncbi:MAG: dihydropteroate synthase [Akkermansiaceae bacterium]|nr:dihydropteroate synthase [Akkermansiaceae bacterium]